MNHILKSLHTELEKTHDLVEHYKLSGIKEYFYSIIGKSFKKVLAQYAREKEDILMAYATLHYDIGKDIKTQQGENEELEHIKIGISSLTHKIEICGKTLTKLNAHSYRQEDILDHERRFFVQMIESFNTDLINWIGAHEKEIFGEVSENQKTENKNFLENGKKLLEKQKQKLDLHIGELSNTEAND